MANGQYQIDETTWKNMTTDDQLWTLYCTFNTYRGVCDGRLSKLEKRQNWNTASAAGSGIIGGFLAALARKMF